MKSLTGLICILSAGMFLGGCATAPPKGKDPGRVETTNTTPAERASPEVQQTALHEFSDQVAQQLAADLSKIEDFKQYRVTVVFGDIVNKTQVVPTSDFEAFRTQIRSKLMQSQNVLKNIRFVENRARLDSLRKMEEGEAVGGRKPLDPKYTYFLNGEMYRSNRAGAGQEVNEYLMSYNLTNMDTGEIVWTNNPYEVKQVR